MDVWGVLVRPPALVGKFVDHAVRAVVDLEWEVAVVTERGC